MCTVGKKSIPFILSLSLCLALSSCKKATEEIGFGKISKGYYINKKLGMGFKYPEKWMTTSGLKLNRQFKGEPSIELNLVPLFEGESAKSSGRNFRPTVNFEVFAERVKYSWRIKNERDYVDSVKKHFRAMKKPDIYNKPGMTYETTYTELVELGRNRLYTFKIVLSHEALKRRYGDAVLHYFIKFHQGYAVVFQALYFSKQKKHKLQVMDILKTVRFKDTELGS